MRISDLIFKEQKNSPYVTWKLRVTRMKKFLENARAFFSAIDDGKEKLDSEYIIDEKYVISLVERVMERTGMMVFDACVLVREGGDTLYSTLDGFWAKARNEFMAPIPKAPESSSSEEPEVARLKNIINWIENGEEEGKSLLWFFRTIVIHLVGGLGGSAFPTEGVSELALFSKAGRETLNLIDLDRPCPKGREKAVLPAEMACRPLGLILLGCEAAPPAGLRLSKPSREWFAATDSDHVSLFAKEAASPFLWLSATLSGHSDADFVFALGKNLMREDFPEGFRVESSGVWSFGWIYDVAPEKIEQSLSELGKKCFA